MTIVIREFRFNAKCKCGTKHSVLARETPAYVSDRDLREGGLVAHARVYFSTHSRVLSDTSGFLYLEHEGGIARTCECGRELVLRRVRGIVNVEHKCDARCTNATGHDCECACGGKNHGAAHG